MNEPDLIKTTELMDALFLLLGGSAFVLDKQKKAITTNSKKTIKRTGTLLGGEFSIELVFDGTKK